MFLLFSQDPGHLMKRVSGGGVQPTHPLGASPHSSSIPVPPPIPSLGSKGVTQGPVKSPSLRLQEGGAFSRRMGSLDTSEGGGWGILHCHHVNSSQKPRPRALYFSFVSFFGGGLLFLGRRFYAKRPPISEGSIFSPDRQALFFF